MHVWVWVCVGVGVWVHVLCVRLYLEQCCNSHLCTPPSVSSQFLRVYSPPMPPQMVLKPPSHGLSQLYQMAKSPTISSTSTGHRCTRELRCQLLWQTLTFTRCIGTSWRRVHQSGVGGVQMERLLLHCLWLLWLSLLYSPHL